MFSRITFILITIFWLCMNFLLWRSEFGWRNHVGAKIPVAVVWQKILTAPDKSQMDIFHHGKRIGDCLWSANFGQDIAAGRILTDGVPPEDSRPTTRGYRIEFYGGFIIPDTPTRLSFTINLAFSTNADWQDFGARLQLHPDTWYVHSRASEQNIHVHMEGEDENSDRVYKFSDLQNPQYLIQEFQLPISLELFDALGVAKASRVPTPALGLDWEARDDWITLGHTAVRVYRLQARLFDRFRIIVMVNQVGEILRVELPDEWVLVVRDPFSNL